MCAGRLSQQVTFKRWLVCFLFLFFTDCQTARLTGYVLDVCWMCVEYMYTPYHSDGNWHWLPQMSSCKACGTWTVLLTGTGANNSTCSIFRLTKLQVFTWTSGNLPGCFPGVCIHYTSGDAIWCGRNTFFGGQQTQSDGFPKQCFAGCHLNLGGRHNAKRLFPNAINTHESKTPKRQTHHDQQNAKTPQNAKRQNAKTRNAMKTLNAETPKRYQNAKRQNAQTPKR